MAKEDAPLPRIFVVDDDPFIHRAIRRILSQTRPPLAETSGFTTIEEAVAEIRRSPPDLVLLDMDFPEGEGAGLRAASRIHRVSPKTPIVMLTSHFDRYRGPARRRGFVGYADKTLDPAQFREGIGCVLTSSRRSGGIEKAIEGLWRSMQLASAASMPRPRRRRMQ